jgi:hypothetical protein
MYTRGPRESNRAQIYTALRLLRGAAFASLDPAKVFWFRFSAFPRAVAGG